MKFFSRFAKKGRKKLDTLKNQLFADKSSLSLTVFGASAKFFMKWLKICLFRTILKKRGHTVENTEQKTMGVGAIFMMIFKISAFTLGGGAVLIGLIKEACERSGLVSEERTSDMLALSLAAPGAMGISMSYQAGLALGGPVGAASAVFGMALPPFIAILALSSWLLAHMGSPFITAFFGGATAALVIVLGAIIYKLMKTNALSSAHNFAVCIFVAAAVAAFKISPVWGLLGGTAVSVAVNMIFEKKGEKA